MKTRTMLSIIMSFVLLISFTVYLGWNGLIYWRTVLPAAQDWIYWVLYALLAYGYLLAMLTRRFLPYRIYKTIKWVGAYGLALMFYGLFTVPLANAAVWVLQKLGYSSSMSVAAAGTVVITFLAILLMVGSRNAWSPVIRRYELNIAKRPADGRTTLRIAVASDIHLGTTVGNGHIKRLLHTMEKIKPDLILIPGDVLDDSIEPFVIENMAETLKNLRAPLGVYACLGNHEYIGGNVEEYVKRMKQIGIEVLVDRTVKVHESFYVAGRKDISSERFTKLGRMGLEELLRECNLSLPIIVLDHQPHRLNAASEAGIDLMLSGHTHRGQMMPNHLITRRVFELDWGYKRKGAMHALVSSGFGFWGPPVRIGSRSEVLDVTLRFAEV
ncbi:metallophosphoesterase [Paenibacillus turpanensis]|uniref:metallophosphoesterase n=1 Tax=Paenibacillus turpanensis TaxID=2689078 RepID=UPI00140960B3|nr:metallophosphoesterase [Paenibacillus turpanensis]